LTPGAGVDAEALALRKLPRDAPWLDWIARPIGMRVEIADKEALCAAPDAEEVRTSIAQQGGGSPD
jgi:hypothetical protein